MTEWRIGCSGFHYKEWKELFYPKGLPASKWLAYYATRFNTLESNVTFYRMPTEASLAKWYTATPDHFTISVKAPRLITHYKKFVGIETELPSFYDTVQNGLQEKLRCVLFQLPPGLAYSHTKLDEIIQQLDKRYNNVLEFRHASWWRDEVYEACGKHNITFCAISHPTLPTTMVCTSSILYCRYHGVPDLYSSSYSPAFLDEQVAMIKSYHNVQTVYLYFNNTMHRAAIDNAEYIEQSAIRNQ